MIRLPYAKILIWLPAIGWTATLYILLKQDVDPETLAWVPDHTDKVIHIIAFALLAWLWLMPLWGALALPLQAAAWVAFLWATLFGAGMEWVQSTLPVREGTVGDALANTVGAATVFVVCHRLLQTPAKRLFELWRNVSE